MTKLVDKGMRPLITLVLIFIFPLFGLTLATKLGVAEVAKENIQLSVADYDQLERDYVSAAFGGKYFLLTKFSNVAPLTRSANCESSIPQKCLSTISLFKYLISETNFLKVVKVKGRSDLSLILAEKDRLPGLRTKLEELFHRGTFDNSSADCQLYTAVSGAVITSAVTVISVDAEPLRAQTCFVVNFYRSLGLALNDGKTFSDVWGYENDPRMRFTSDKLEELKYRANVLLHIHACKELRPGMTRNQVEIELNPDSECLKQLTGGLNGQ